MKISEIEKMRIDQILDKFEFPPSFIKDFKNWCKAQPKKSVVQNPGGDPQEQFFGVNRQNSQLAQQQGQMDQGQQHSTQQNANQQTGKKK